MECGLCDREINRESNAKEHIIPDAIGGRRTVRGYICKACNNDSGRTWDAALARALHPFSLLLNIKRQKGTIGPLKVKSVRGEPFIYHPGNRIVTAPSFRRETLPDGQIHIHMQDSTRSALEARIKGLERKYPQASVDKWRVSVGERDNKTLYGFDLSYGGPEFDRSIVKSALALSCWAGVDVGECRLGVDYLRDSHAEYDHGLYFSWYQDDLVMKRTRGLPMHCVYVTGDPISRTLLAYVELFGNVRRIICLSDTYESDHIVESYVIDPVTGRELSDVAVGLDYAKFSQMASTYSQDGVRAGLSQALGEVLSYCDQLNQRRVFEQHFGRSMDECLSELGLSPDREWSHREKHDFSHCVTDKLIPLLEYWLSPLDLPEGLDPN